MSTVTETTGKWTHRAVLGALFLGGVLLLYFRNTAPFLHPTLYGEDGLWVALGLENGWFYALTNARPDYFVFLNIILLFLATQISTWLTESPLTLLPQAIAVVSLCFFSALAVFTFVTVKRFSSFLPGLFAFLTVLLMPLGFSVDEIMGRLLQIGFYMPLLAVLLLFWRDKISSWRLIFGLDLLLLLCAGTNPLVLAICVCHLCFDFFKDRNVAACIWRNFTLIVSVLTLTVFLLPRMGGKGGIPGAFVGSSLVEAVTARSILYPFLFPWYGELANTVSVLLIGVFACLVVFACRQAGSQELKRLTLFTVATLLIYEAATFIMRPGLTGFLSNYQTTYPDRYFMGINVLAVFLMALVVARFLSSRGWRVAGGGLAALVLGTYAWGWATLFDTSPMAVNPTLTFEQQLCLSEVIDGTSSSSVQIYPLQANWLLTMPSRYIDKENCTYINPDDVGVARAGDVFRTLPSAPLAADTPIKLLMTASHQQEKTGLQRVGVMFGTYARQNVGDAELHLRGPDGAVFFQRFSLSGLADNQYRYFDLDGKRYTDGEIVSVSGGGVSSWISLDAQGVAHTCLIYEYAGGRKKMTPGCS